MTPARSATRWWAAFAALLVTWGSALATSFARLESATDTRIGGWMSVLGAILTRWWSRLTATRGWARLAAFTARWWRVLGRPAARWLAVRGMPAVRWWSRVTATRPFVRRWVPMALAALIVVGPIVGTVGVNAGSSPNAANMADLLAAQQRSPQADSAHRSEGDRASRDEIRRKAPGAGRGSTSPVPATSQPASPAASAAPATTEPAHPTPVAGLSQVQMDHAKTIVDVGKQMGLPRQAYIVAVSTALQETQLQVMANWGLSDSLNQPHDGVGSDHDSVGLFQQRPSAGWGTIPELMDPATSARRFYEALERVSGWENMPVTVAAQTVQGSAYPDAYAQQVPEATQIVNALGS